MKAKGYYDLFIKKNKLEPPFVTFWQAYFKLPNTFVWESVLKCKFLLINDNRIKQFNFKLLHRILPSKDNLYKWRIINDNLCDSCGIPETTFHFLLSCKKIKAYWKIVSRMLMYTFNVNIDINEKNIFLGYNFENSKMKLVNLVLIFAQFIIYRNYIRDNNQDRKHRTHALYLLRELKSEIRSYFNFKFNQNNLEKKEITKLCQYLKVVDLICSPKK